MKHIPNLDEARGIFAMVVVLAHIYLMAGLLPEQSGIFQHLIINHAAVDVFIILSGLVIFFMLETRQEPYHLYIIRRAFRIFPAYLICLAILIPLLPFASNAVQSLPWQTAFIQGEIGAFNETMNNFIPNIMTHLTLTQGLFTQWIPYSAFTFLGPAWSLSLEWQFYLVAPMIWVCFKSRNRIIIALTILALSLAFWKFRFGENLGFLPQKIPYFIIGILCFYALKLREIPNSNWSRLAIFAFLAIYSAWVGSIQGYEGIILWFAIFPFSYFNIPILEHRILQYFGKISFSIYISHMTFVYIGVMALQGFHIQDRWQYFAYLYLISVPMTIGFSHLLYHQVEKPFMDFSKHLCKQWQQKLSYS